MSDMLSIGCYILLQSRDQRDHHFSLYLKGASVFLALFLQWKVVRWAAKTRSSFKSSPVALDPKPGLAYLAFALYVLTLSISVLYGIYIAACLFDSPEALPVIGNTVALALITSMCFLTRAYYLRNRPGRKPAEIVVKTE